MKIRLTIFIVALVTLTVAALINSGTPYKQPHKDISILYCRHDDQRICKY